MGEVCRRSNLGRIISFLAFKFGLRSRKIQKLGVYENAFFSLPLPLPFCSVWVAVAAVFAFFAPLLYAQAACPDGSDIDALGCSTQPATQSFSKESISALSVQERPQSGTPSPDLSGGASYSEVSTQTGPPKSEVRAAPFQPPNEFQRFVHATTGQLPPIYGAKFFSTQPTSFGPIERGPAPGDLLRSALTMSCAFGFGAKSTSAPICA